MSRRPQSNGSAGEYAASLWFKRHGWVMFRTQPATRVVWKGKVPVVINVGTGGIADYTGYYGVWPYPYRACEGKEAHGDSMPASTLDVKQRAWMDALPAGCAWVCVLWDTGVCEGYEYVRTGSYKRGAGVV